MQFIPTFTTARDLFESAREASKDAERCRRQILTLESRASSLGGGGTGQRVSSTPDPKRMELRIATYVDQERKLDARMEDDYRLIDLATRVLYGCEGVNGVDSVSPTWADVLWWRYLDNASWRDVARAVDYSPTQCQTFAKNAFAWLDEVELVPKVLSASMDLFS